MTKLHLAQGFLQNYNDYA